MSANPFSREAYARRMGTLKPVTKPDLGPGPDYTKEWAKLINDWRNRA